MNKRITARIIKKAIQLLEHGWCQRHYAETKMGFPCREVSEEANRFCAVGSLLRASDDLDTTNMQYQDARSHIFKYIPKIHTLTSFNDERTTKQADVIKVFKRALRPLVKA